MMEAAEVDRLLSDYRRSGDRRARNQVVEAHLGIADHVVRRTARTSAVPADDLRQTALLAMIRATDRYRSGRGATFKTFALRTIDGEIKRYLRDRTWTVRPPRGPQERFLEVCRVRSDLTDELRRHPTTSEIAERADLTVEAVLHALEAGAARHPSALETTNPDGSATVRHEMVALDLNLSALDDRLDLRRAFDVLDDRQREVLHLRFVDELSQPDIAARLGISQSYTSRVISDALSKLRTDILQERPSGERALVGVRV